MTIYNSISSNKRKTFFIIVFFIIFIATVSYILSRALGYGLSFVGVMLVISGLMSFFSYYYSDKIVLSMSGAKPATKEEFPDLFNIVENLTIASGVPMPKVFIIDDPAPNAFATGRDPKHAVVAATTGILSILKKAELEGVMAHELSHVKNYDTRLMGVVAILAGSVALLADFFMRSLWMRGDDDDRNGNTLIFIAAILVSILAPIVATLIQLAISRRREFLADADGALLTRYPEGLALALEKISSDPKILRSASVATAHFFIEDPFKADAEKRSKSSWFVNLFNTHPPIEERVKILRSM